MVEWVNQIHEYAFARYLSRLSGQEVGVNTFFYGPDYPHRIIRIYDLGAFSCSIARLSSEKRLERDPIAVDGKPVEDICEQDVSIPELIERVKREPDMSCALLGFWHGHLS